MHARGSFAAAAFRFEIIESAAVLALDVHSMRRCAIARVGGEAGHDATGLKNSHITHAAAIEQRLRSCAQAIAEEPLELFVVSDGIGHWRTRPPDARCRSGIRKGARM